MWVLSWWPAAGSPRSCQCVQRIYRALRTYIWNVHEVEVHCPIRHPSRDMTKIIFQISKLRYFYQIWGKWHFCDAPLSFTVFDLKFNDPNIYPHMHIRSRCFAELLGACIDRSGTATLLLSAAVGAWCLLHLACYLFQYTSRWPILSKESRTFTPYTLHHGMLGLAVQW